MESFISVFCDSQILILCIEISEGFSQLRFSDKFKIKRSNFVLHFFINKICGKYYLQHCPTFLVLQKKINNMSPAICISMKITLECKLFVASRLGNNKLVFKRKKEKIDLFRLLSDYLVQNVYTNVSEFNWFPYQITYCKVGTIRITLY